MWRTRRAYESVDRKGLYAFLLSMKDPSGGFRMHDDGEVDVRGTYTALAVAAVAQGQPRQPDYQARVATDRA